jgi:hypothetical protein
LIGKNPKVFHGESGRIFSTVLAFASLLADFNTGKTYFELKGLSHEIETG